MAAISNLGYAGRTADADSTLVNRGYVDNRWSQLTVDNTFIDGQMITIQAGLTSKSYVDAQDNSVVHKSYVDTQDSLYIPNTSKGQALGVVGLDGSVYVPSANLPSLLTERIAGYAFASGAGIKITAAQNVQSTTNTLEYFAATLNIADPGFPYVPMVFGQVTGAAVATTDPGNGNGVGIYGQAIVYDTNNVAYGRTVTSGNYHKAAFPVFPWGTAGTTPANITGPLTLNMYMSLFSVPTGSTGTPAYQFLPEGLVFGAMIFPGN